MKPITLIYGKNTFLMQQAIDKVIDQFIEGGGERDEIVKIRVDSDTKPDEVLLQMQNVSLFASKKLTILYDITTNTELAESIEQFCGAADENSWLAIVDTTLLARSKVVKYVQVLPNAQTIKCDQKKDSELTMWASDYVQALNPKARLNSGNADYLIQRVGEDQQLLASELQKLVAGLSDGGEIDKNYIEALVEITPQGSVFAMLDAMLAAQPEKAIAVYHEQIAQGAAPQQIIGMIVWQMTQLAIVVDGKQRSNKELTDLYGVSSFAVSKLRPLAQRLTMRDIASIVRELMEADYQSRTHASADDAVEYIVSYISAYLMQEKTATT